MSRPLSVSSRAVLTQPTRIIPLIILIVLGLSLLWPRFLGSPVQAAPWSLTNAQRRAYLQYYAPVILKRGDENTGKEGRDWLTNYDFDQDHNFATNRVNWRNVNAYVSAATNGTGAYSNWRIRPTLYTSLIEYMDGGSKSIVMLYHVYNAADKDGSEIHDWERVEIAVRGVTGSPGGTGETVNYVTVTHHHDHIIRRSYDSGLNFMPTATGKHVLIWQADESDSTICGTYGHELRFVKNSYSSIASQSPFSDAEVNVSGKDEAKNVHYVFVPDGSSAAISSWNAKPLNYATAANLNSHVDNENTQDWNQVKRVTYELQDLADVFPTHWQNNNWYTHWLSSESSDVLLESPIINEAGQAEVSTGLQRFYTKSRDNGKSDLTDGREGIPDKDWFYGSYAVELDEDCPSGSKEFDGYSGQGLDSYGRSRGIASGYLDSHNTYWWQHDFFAHSGPLVDPENREAGVWLSGAWYTAANGGFDGRWVQLFDDRPGAESSPAPQPTATPRPTTGTLPTVTPRPTTGTLPTATPRPTTGTLPTATPQPTTTKEPIERCPPQCQ